LCTVFASFCHDIHRLQSNVLSKSKRVESTTETAGTYSRRESSIEIENQNRHEAIRQGRSTLGGFASSGQPLPLAASVCSPSAEEESVSFNVVFSHSGGRIIIVDNEKHIEPVFTPSKGTNRYARTNFQSFTVVRLNYRDKHLLTGQSFVEVRFMCLKAPLTKYIPYIIARALLATR